MAGGSSCQVVAISPGVAHIIHAGAFSTSLERYRIELWGVPLGHRTRRQVEHILQPVGRLHKIVCNVIHEGNRNCLCVDVEVRAGGPISASIPTYGGGLGSEILVAILPTPPPRPQRSPHKSLDSAPTPLSYTSPAAHAMKPLAEHSYASADFTSGSTSRSPSLDSSRPSPAASQPPSSTSLQPQLQPQPVSSPSSHNGTVTTASDIRSIQAAPPEPAATSQTRPIVY